MEPDFWLSRWQEGRIGFHQDSVNQNLRRHIEELDLATGSRVFVPLCGKTLDIGWLIQQGFAVIGSELALSAVEALFDSLKLNPVLHRLDTATRYQAEKLTVFCGDIFDLDPSLIGRVDAVYDRAALIALPEHMRPSYAKHVADLTACAPQLLVTLDYDQNCMEGPPFALSRDLIKALYGDAFNIAQLDKQTIEGGLKGRLSATEYAWKLIPHSG